ncbi:tetratricopeptide repeat protein [Larkinella soli]|uniref:tetratricopeptide repeat protein n=1 Tax=Larkinella soli TaxID=1770527 RepID=UPI000FFB456D|nr:tetratricopeptide repeat protein [Larkinella soli]
MKRLSFFLLAGLLSAGAFAQQGLDAVTEKAFLSEKEKSDKAITDAKNSAKAKTWMDRAQTYEKIATQAIKLDSNAAIVAYEAYGKVVEMDKDKNGGPGKLAKEAQEALKGQNMYSAMMNAGAGKYQAKKFDEAAKLMGMAGQINPKDTTAALYTGIAAQQAQQLPMAKEQFERYIANGGKDPSVFYTLANLYRQEKDIDKAVATLDKGLAALPGNKDLAAERVNVLVQSGRSDDAIASMKQLAEKDPNNATNLLNLGILYDNNVIREADELRKLNESVKKGPDATKQLADEKTALTTMQGELSRLNARAKKEPKNADVKRQIATVTQMIADSKTKVSNLEKDVQAQAQQSQGAGNSEQKIADLTKKLSEDRALAREYYGKVLQLDQNNYDANFNLGVSHFNEAVEMKKQVDGMDMKEYQVRGKEVEGRVCGKFKQALPYFEKAKTVRDADADLNENLTNLRNILKQFEEKKIACIDPK